MAQKQAAGPHNFAPEELQLLLLPHSGFAKAQCSRAAAKLRCTTVY